MSSDKYLFIDIGSAETKIIEASVQHGKITLLKAAEMPDMSLFISSSSIIKSVEGFCYSLKKTLEDNLIKTRRAFICSSILGLHISDISSEFKNYKECLAQFKKKYNRTTKPTLACDWQFMGEIVADNSIISKLLCTSGPINIVENFLLAMHNIAGVIPISLESSFTAQANLQTLFSASFDLPSIAVIELGRQQVLCQYFKNGAFAHQTALKPDILKLGVDISEHFNLPLPKAQYLLHEAGIKEDLCMPYASAEGFSAEEYCNFIEDYLKNLLEDIQNNILNVASAKQLENVRVIFTGGLLDIPGISDFIRRHYSFTPYEIMEIPTRLDSRNFSISNKLNCALNAKYSNCVGMLLKSFNSIHTTNIIPKDLMLIDFGKVAGAFTKIASLLFAAGIVLSIGFGFMPLVKSIQKQGIHESLNEAVMIQDTLALKVQDYETYLTNIQSINKSLTPFLKYLARCETDNLRIASVDTENILGAQVSSNKDKSIVENLAGQSPLSALVLRGYAKTSNDITYFYNTLQNSQAIGSVSITGIREVSLSNQDKIFIFEMKLEVVPDAQI